MRYLLRVWTGPCLVRQIADKLTEAGVEVTYAGTETVLVEADGADGDGATWNVLVDMTRTHKTDFGLRPSVVRRIAQVGEL
jgi:hypothetical protein